MNNLLLANLADFKFILGSQSPRRKELLKMMGLEFTSISLDIDETFDREIYKAEKITEFLASKKSHAYLDMKEKEILITSDTTVWVENQSLEKPIDYKEAKEMLELLSAKSHSVYSSVTLRSVHQELTFSDETKVVFKELSAQEIDYYIRHFQPYDKAGAYGIQEWIGLIGIEKIDGNYFNVMGLPTEKLFLHLQNFLDKENKFYQKLD